MLPDLLNCREFVNADNIAAGLSPFNPQSVALEAGRIMLQRISTLMENGADFAFETTLSTRSYVSLIKKAQSWGYEVTLLYFWLSFPQVAIDRVAKRVSQGGHHIPNDVVVRRYYRGISNLLNLYIPICDNWMVNNNTEIPSITIAKSSDGLEQVIINNDIWNTIKQQYHDHQ